MRKTCLGMEVKENEIKSSERIGILGGTFDPIHLGHLRMALAARSARGLRRVLLIPSSTPPHKRGEPAPPFHRMEMVRIAAAPHTGIEASDLEIRRGGISFTVDTLEAAARSFPGTELHFIIGEDSIPELPLWKDVARIFDLARIVAVNRPGPRHRFEPEVFPGISEAALERCERDRLEMEPVPIASRDIRKLILAGEPFDHLLPPGVGDYIRRFGLYGYKSREMRP